MCETRTATTLFPRWIAVTLLLLALAMSTTAPDARADDGEEGRKPPPNVRIVDPPKRVDFRLVDDVRITGTLESWDEDGINGSFGRRAWTEIDPHDAWTLHVAFADRDSAADWVNLGRIMLLHEETTRAEQAFRRAVSIDPEADVAVGAARASAEEELARRAEAERLAELARLRTVSPEVGPWTSDVWPMLSPEEQAAAVQEVKSKAEDILTSAGMDLRPIETELIVMYSDADRVEAAKLVIRLERAYRRLARLFEIHSSQNIFHGKAVVFLFTDHDRYRLVEAEAFNQLVPHGALGLAHYDGPRVFLCFYKHDDPERLLWHVLVEFTHAFMHRLISPARLPAWGNDGLAHVIAAQEMEDTLAEKDRRVAALEFIRSGASVIELLDRTYKDFDWTDVWTRFGSVSGLIVELMIRDRPQAFLQWVRAVKHGKQWREALSQNFGVEPREIVETSVQHYMVND